VSSTAKGEIAYARYVYEFTPQGDTTIRAPIANFWAMRSHTLRAEAEEEFKSLCLEFPQFGYDVLSTFLLYSLLSGCVVDDTNMVVQPASSTRSSSARRTRRCTPRLAAPGSGPGTAKSKSGDLASLDSASVDVKLYGRRLAWATSVGWLHNYDGLLSSVASRLDSIGSQVQGNIPGLLYSMRFGFLLYFHG
jgi:hypothetical protein